MTQTYDSRDWTARPAIVLSPLQRLRWRRFAQMSSAEMEAVMPRRGPCKCTACAWPVRAEG